MGTPRAPFLPSLQLPPQRTPNGNHVHWRSPTSLVKRLGPATPLTHSPERLHMSMDETTPLLNHAKSFPSPSSSPPLPHMRAFLLQQDNERSQDSSQTQSNGVIGIEEGWGRCKIFQNAKVNGTNSLGVHKPHFYLEANMLKATLRRELVEKAPEHVLTAFKAIPAVLLGSLLNILDGVSCECCSQFFKVLHISPGFAPVRSMFCTSIFRMSFYFWSTRLFPRRFVCGCTLTAFASTSPIPRACQLMQRMCRIKCPLHLPSAIRSGGPDFSNFV
jgi:hypothetical protein